MAKKKMTLEEKLEEAIVKDAPYEVPENWSWTYMNNIGEYINGKAFKPIDWDTKGLPIIRIQNLTGTNGEFNYFSGEIEEKYKIANNDLLMAWSATLDAFLWDGNDAVLNQHIFKVKSLINKKYHYYLLKNTIQEMYSKTHGTGMVHITKGKFEKLEVPLPPLKEQQRIVDKIESLFEKLDKAEELIEEARDDFEKRKKSIIKKALTGKYVSGVELTEVELGNILNFKNGMSKRTGKEGNETKVLRLADISSDTICSDNARSMLLTEKEIVNYKIEYGDLLIIRVNGTKRNVGKAIEYIGDDICAYCDHLIRIDCSQLNKKYIKYLINSDDVRRQIDGLIVSSAGQNTISQSSLNKIKTMWAEDVKVQQDIVNVIDMLINKEKKIEELTALEDQIELIKKSILAKAFRGQLGTNSEDDESAVELLKEILSREQ